MRRAVSAVLLAAVMAGPALAQDAPPPMVDDPITLRMNAMDQNAAAAGTLGAILRGEAEFEPRVVNEAFRMMHAVALGYGYLFPPGSEDEHGTRALPAIWEQSEAFDEAVQAYIDDTRAAVMADVSNVEALQPVFANVGANCRSCHETFRRPND